MIIFQNLKLTKGTLDYYKSILENYLQVINYEDVNNYVVENSNSLIYITSKNSNYSEFEQDFSYLIKEYNLYNDILYLDISNNINNGIFYINDYSFKNYPLFILYNNGNITSIYDIKGNSFNIVKIKMYLESVGIIEND